jgi:hypothetical protein
MEKKYLAVLLGGAELLAATIVGLAALSPVARPSDQFVNAGGNVVANQPHAFDSVDAAFGGFVGVPILE